MTGLMMRARSLAAVFAAALLLSLGLSTDRATAADETGRLNVSVTGEAAATPDMATVSVGVVTEDATAAGAMAAQRTAMAAVLNAAVEAGVAEPDIQTSGLSVNPRYSRSQDNDQPRITGYSASNRVTVIVRSIDKAGALLDALVGAGANEIDGVSFGLQDPASAREQARADALARLAERKAFYESTGGLKLGRIMDLSEHADAPPMMARERVQFSQAATPVAPGQLTISVQLNASYEILE